jgi:D-arginine dehydrogenase
MNGIDGRSVDVVVVGAGVAGAAVAESLVLLSDSTVIVAEAASVPGLHSSGRSVSVFDPLYGDASVRVLSDASRPRLEAGLADGRSLLDSRELIMLVRADQEASATALYPEGTAGVDRLTEDQLRGAFPALRGGRFVGGISHRGGADLDVDRLHQGLLTAARRAGASVLTDHPVIALAPQRQGGWRVQIGNDIVHATTVVNAAGAWADHVGTLAGSPPPGIVPYRRSVGVATSPVHASSRWPMIVDIDMRWYLKPDGGSFLISPAEATAVPPGDPRPDELEMARCIDAINEATTLGIRSLTRTWAGLRCYTADERPIIGFDDAGHGLFWHAGFGGFGIQVAPAAGRLAAQLILGHEPDIDPMPYRPDRFAETT